MSARVLIATPFRGAELHSAHVTVGYHQFTNALQHQLGAVTLPGTMMLACDVVRARNRAVGTVLREAAFADITHILWIDDDNFPEDIADGVRVVREMIGMGEGIVAAPYTNKRQPLRWTHQGIHGEDVDERGLLAVRCVGFGFTLTSRECLQRMADCHETEPAAGEYWDLPNEHKIANVFGQVYDLDEKGREFLASEDYSFCKRWRLIGGDVFLYTRAGIIQHAGTHTWSARDMAGGVVT